MNLRIVSFDDEEPKQPDGDSQPPLVDPTNFGIDIKEKLVETGIDLTGLDTEEEEEGWDDDPEMGGLLTFDEGAEDKQPTLRFFDPESDESKEV